MFGLFTKTLRRRLIALMFVASIVPVVAIAYFGIRYSSDALYNIQETNIKNDLLVLSEAMIHQGLGIKIHDMEALIDDEKTMVLIDELSAIESPKINKPVSDGAISTISEPIISQTTNINTIISKLDERLAPRINFFGFKNIFILNKHGKIIYDLANKDKTGLELAKISDAVLKDTISRVFSSKISTYSDLEISSFNNNKPTQFLGVPDKHSDGEIDLIFVGVLDGDWLTRSIHDFSTVARGEGVEVHIIGTDGKIRMSKNRSASSTKELGLSVKSELIDHLIKEKAWSGLTIDEEGVDVIGATIPFDTSIDNDANFDFKWGIGMEVPAQLVFAPVYKLTKDIIIVAVILIVLFTLIAYFFANSIARPVASLAGYANQVAEGNLSVNMAIKDRSDEIGSLTTSFKAMIESLKAQTLQMSSASSQLSSSMQEIAATVTQLSSSVTETTAAVNEITSTIEEIRQISTLSHQKAEDMAGKADSVRIVADEGKTATQKVSNGISEINRQVESIATTTIKLGEQTKNISEIIDSVTDIADQSNLLSVNASIEAAKAGEYGKGFSVVAREIKSLADKSKDSTKQIKEILTDIQKSASSAIMATEKGTKTVSEGLELSKTSKIAIENLESSIDVAVSTATQIVSSSKEQLSGMNQLFETVGSIKQAMGQNSESIRQLEKEAKNLAQLASSLKDLAGKFTVK